MSFEKIVITQNLSPSRSERYTRKRNSQEFTSESWTKSRKVSKRKRGNNADFKCIKLRKSESPYSSPVATLQSTHFESTKVLTPSPKGLQLIPHKKGGFKCFKDNIDLRTSPDKTGSSHLTTSDADNVSTNHHSVTTTKLTESKSDAGEYDEQQSSFMSEQSIFENTDSSSSDSETSVCVSNLISTSCNGGTIVDTETRTASPITDCANDYESSSNEEIEDVSTEFEPSSDVNFPIMGNKRLLVLQKNSVVYMQGVASLKVIYGSVEIHGCTLTENSQEVDVYSPRGTSLLYIHALVNDDNELNLNALELSRSIIEDLNNSVTEIGALILCNRVTGLNTNFIEKHIPQQLFPKEDVLGFKCRFIKQSIDWNITYTSEEWDMLSNRIKGNSKVMLCGGKGVGKSTLLRYLINRLLKNYSEVKVIDLDPGQPEFTIPGCVSICTVRKPVLGPNYTHFIKPDRCVFVSNINISFNPEEYLANIEELLVDYIDKNDAPTLVNYMGYTRGLGFCLTSSAIALVNPNTVVQIESKYKKKNFDKQLTIENVKRNAQFLRQIPVFQMAYEFVVLQSLSDTNKGFDLQPRQLRELRVLTYFSSFLPKSVESLTDPEVPIYKTDLRNLKLIANGTETYPAVVNANLIALCSILGNRSGYDMYDCKGWGIVRGINLSTNELFLLTPEPPAVLDNVNCLVYGSVNLPPSLYMTGDGAEGLIPYVSLGARSSFSSVPKRTHVSRTFRNSQRDA